MLRGALPTDDAAAAAAVTAQQQAAADDISAALQAVADGGADLLKAADVVTDMPPMQQAVNAKPAAGAAPPQPQATLKAASPPPPPPAVTPKPPAPAPQPTPSPTKRVMVGPAVPADWRDKDALATVTATLTFDAPRIGPFNPATRDAVRKAVEATVGSEGELVCVEEAEGKEQERKEAAPTKPPSPHLPSLHQHPPRRVGRIRHPGRHS